MKTTTLLLITTITASFTQSVMAENNTSNTPPSGPYRSANQADPAIASTNNGNTQTPPAANYAHPNWNMPDHPQAVPPEWVKKQQAEMDKWIKQQNERQQEEWAKQTQPPEVPDWVKQRQNQMPEWAKQMQPPEVPDWVKQRQNQMPEWAKQQQAQMEQMMKQQNMLPQSNWNNQAPAQWNHNQPIPAPNYALNPYANRMQQHFPSARGPVYGPATPPPVFNNQPGYQPPAQWNPYPPVRR